MHADISLKLFKFSIYIFKLLINNNTLKENKQNITVTAATHPFYDNRMKCYSNVNITKTATTKKHLQQT